MPEYLVLKGKVVEVESSEKLYDGKDKQGNPIKNRCRKIKAELEGRGKMTVNLMNTDTPVVGADYTFKGCLRKEFKGNQYYTCWSGIEQLMKQTSSPAENKEPAKNGAEPPNQKEEYLSTYDTQRLIVRQNVLNRAVELCIAAGISYTTSPEGLKDIDFDAIEKVAERLKDWVQKEIIVEIPF